MAKAKIPHGYYRDPRTGRLRKKQTRKQTGKGHRRRRKQTGKGIGAVALPLAKMLAPIIVPIALKEAKKAVNKITRGSGLRLMGQNKY